MIILKDDVKEHFSWDDEFEEKDELSEEEKAAEQEDRKEVEKEEKIAKKKKKSGKKSKNKGSKKYVWAAILLIIAASLFIVYKESLFPKEDITVKTTVAVVNGQEISSDELDTSYKLFVPEMLQALTPKEVFLNESLIPEIILAQEAEKEGILPDSGKADFYINNLVARMGVTEDEFVSELGKEGLSLEDVKEAYKKKIMIAELLDEKISSNIVVTEKEIKEYYDRNTGEYSAKEGEIRASHILITVDDKTSDKDAKSMIDELYERAKKGEDFAELAREYSKCPSASDGGDLGFFSKGQMVPEFEEAAFSLEIGEVSEPVKTQFGYHIIKRGKDALSFEEAKNSINTSLFTAKQESALETYVNQLKAKSEIKIISEEEDAIIEEKTENGVTFEETGDEICKEGGKAVIRLFSAEVDPHSQWVSGTFNKVAKEYSGKIAAYNWQIDTGDDLLTEIKEEKIPRSEIEIYKKYNIAGSVPTFVFGCKYSRIGNGYEEEGSLKKEEAEFRKLIEGLV